MTQTIRPLNWQIPSDANNNSHVANLDHGSYLIQTVDDQFQASFLLSNEAPQWIDVPVSSIDEAKKRCFDHLTTFLQTFFEQDAGQSSDHTLFDFNETLPLFEAAILEASKGAQKYPQPCKIPPVLKLPEEAGEAVQAGNKFIENKGSLSSYKDELIQIIAVIIRLFHEGDATFNIPPLKILPGSKNITENSNLLSAFDHGYLIACSNLVNMHDEPDLAGDILDQINLSVEQIEAMDLSEIDLSALEAITKSGRKHNNTEAIKRVQQEYGCHLELEESQEPDPCVFDYNRPDDCIYAKKCINNSKWTCQYWQKIKHKINKIQNAS